MCYNVFVTSARFFRAFPAMAPRQAVLLTPSISSLRLIQGVSSAQITHETPQILFFVFKSLRTLSFSVSCKSCVCHSYANGRGVYQQFPFRNSQLLRSWRHSFRPLCPVPFARPHCFSVSSLGTCHQTQVLYFHIIPDSFALSQRSTLFFSCTSGLFGKNTRGWEGQYW